MSVHVKPDGTPGHTDVPDGVMSLEDLRLWHTAHDKSAFDSAEQNPTLGGGRHGRHTDEPQPNFNGEQSR